MIILCWRHPFVSPMMIAGLLASSTMGMPFCGLALLSLRFPLS
jgi:hypothetical protein